MSRTKAIGCRQNMFVSDHNSIQCILNIPKKDCAQKEVTYRKLKEVDLAQLVDDMSLEEIKTKNLHEMVVIHGRKLFNCFKQPSPRGN